MNLKPILITTLCLLLPSQFLFAESHLSIEENRIDKAKQVMPAIFMPLAAELENFAKQINKAENLTTLTQHVLSYGTKLWQKSVVQFKESGRFDDRVLYWSRLEMSKFVKLSPVYSLLLPTQQQDILWKLELLTRGQQDIKFDKSTNKKILITGFDPFFLDKNIDQSNPSGVAALALDDLVINFEGKSAEIETLIVPVRFADFDQGMIEELLAPYYDQVDMIITISMGRENFDLERFPSLRRSAKAPDNANIYTGANQKSPLVPLLNGKPLTSPEFVEFSLPVAAMQKALGNYKINDNKNITTLSGKRTAESLTELATETSVEGSGGGYLSNEVSYRSIVMRNKLNANLPVGHIHTPRIKAFEPEISKKIVEQIKLMLSFALTQI
jgi:pyrrolidone-carboxylate peptidase